MKKLLLLAISLLLSFVLASGQVTKVKGRVVDAETGEAVPFAGLFFKGTTIGTNSDLDGYYSLEIRNLGTDVLVCQLLGYDTVEKTVVKGSFNTIDFQMHVTDNQLTGVVVKADNRKVRRLLANIDAHRDRNNPDRHDQFSCDVYNRMELDLTHAQEQLTDKKFLKEFGFVFNYMDTSSVSGVPYLPIMISESVAKRYHTGTPSSDTERIVANRISGINPDNNLLSQFTGSMHLKTNFYTPFINAFGVQMPSPIQNGGLLYYNYYIVDSLNVDGRKTYVVNYHPKSGISTPAFDGSMRIDAEDYALVSVHAKMKHGGNVNWLRDIVLDSDYQRLPDSTWFYSFDKLYADFSIALGDSSKVMSVIGTRQMTYSNISMNPESVKKAVPESMVSVDEDSNLHDEAYWAGVRPYELSQKEKNIYKMVDEIKDVPLYQTVYDVVYTAINGYWELGKVGFGPYFKLISFNNLEGLRPQIGVHTSRDFSTKHRFTVYAAYGTRDRKWKGGLQYERMFRRDLTRKLTLDVHKDVVQLGKGTNILSDANILSSILGKGNAQRLCPTLAMSAKYEHEFNPCVTTIFETAFNRYFSNGFVPMLLNDGTPVGSVASNELRASIRFSKDETVNRGYFVKKYLHTFYPVLTLSLNGSVPGIRKNDVGYFRPELTMDWRFRIASIGLSKLHLNVGTIVGDNIPYPLLHLHEGNGTYVLDKTAFSCMDYFEFVSDSWATLFWHHCFNGFFLGKIPLLRKLNLREEFTLKTAYGTLRDANNPKVGNRPDMMAFPVGLGTMGKVPYVEAGAGVSNIFRVFRVDCFWRLTHRERHPFTVTVGAELRF